MSYYHPELPYIAFLAAVLVLVPLPWHWRAGNVATLAMIAWLFVINIIYGVDAAIWGHSIDTVIPVWCDITTKIIIGANIALPAACMCVCIHLEQVASMRQVRISAANKRRRQIIEGLLCYLVPMIWMGLHYIVQGHRFDIIEIYGCRPTTYVSIPAIFLIWVPPLILSTISMVYAALAFTHFMRRRISFAKHLQNSQSGLNTSRYLRLMMMAIIEMIIGVASTSVTLAFSVEWDMRPWTNWSDVHWNFSRIDAYPILGTPQYVLNYDLAIWWMIPISSCIFFLFFAFGQEAMKEYTACLKWIQSREFRRKGTNTVMESVDKFYPLPSPSIIHESCDDLSLILSGSVQVDLAPHDNLKRLHLSIEHVSSTEGLRPLKQMLSSLSTHSLKRLEVSCYFRADLPLSRTLAHIDILKDIDAILSRPQFDGLKHFGLSMMLSLSEADYSPGDAQSDSGSISTDVDVAKTLVLSKTQEMLAHTSSRGILDLDVAIIFAPSSNFASDASSEDPEEYHKEEIPTPRGDADADEDRISWPRRWDACFIDRS